MERQKSPAVSQEQRHRILFVIAANMSDVTSFSIDLERPSGIYFAGEVVRGTVTLVTSKDIKTRGVRIRYQGLGYSHFYSRAGQYKTDFYGSRIYEEQRYTMFGNYYNTLVLEQAGIEAVFGAANGDGLMYIPCNEGEDLSLIVRVMGHSSIRTHDLLGEVLLNTSTFLAAAEPVNFPLKRNGAATLGQITLSATVVPLSTLFPNSTTSPFAGMERVEGRTYNAICQLRTHTTSGLPMSALIGKNDVYVQAYRAPTGVDSTKALPEPDYSAVLPSGTLEFPFSFPVSEDSPGSVEVRAAGSAGGTAYVRYTLYANIDIPFWIDPFVHRVITVLPSRPLPPPALLRGIEYKSNVPLKMASSVVFSWFSGIGDITFDAKLLRQAFAPGENLEFSMRLFNNTTSVLSVECSLVCNVSMESTIGIKIRRNRDISYKMFSGKVDPKELCELSSADSTTDPSNTTGNTTTRATDTTSVTTNRTTTANTTHTKVALALPIPAVFPSFGGARGISIGNVEPFVFSYSVVFKVSVPVHLGSVKTISLPV